MPPNFPKMEDYYSAKTARNLPKLRESCAPQHRNFLVGLHGRTSVVTTRMAALVHLRRYSILDAMIEIGRTSATDRGIMRIARRHRHSFEFLLSH